jgi:Domain of unknown function (DUF5658)
MTQLVLDIRAAQILPPSAAIEVPATEVAKENHLRLTLVMALLLASLQVMDGFLTFVGVLTFGTVAEGNILIKTLIETVGVVPALVSVKAFAIGVIYVLYNLASNVRWVPHALGAVSAIYITFAIVPWCMVLSRYMF